MKKDLAMGKTQFDLTFNELSIDGFEKVVEVVEKNHGLHAIIAIHNTDLGPALGGIRAYPYASFEQALEDALRLSKGMTYKSAISQSGTAGGKSVILSDKKFPKSDKQLEAFAEAVNHLNGLYICAEDVGISVSDLGVIGNKTRYAVGMPHPLSSGDPSPFTAFGGFMGIRAVAKTLWNTPNLKGKTFAIQGLGSVGMKLAERLFWEGAKLIVADVKPEFTKLAEKNFAATVVSKEEIFSTECDIFVPCAMGGILNSETIPSLKCKAVAGLANNQLLTDEDGFLLQKLGILYAPDFVINSGGLLNVCLELEEEGYSPFTARENIERIYDLLLEIFSLAQEKGLPTHKVAEAIAESNLERKIGKRIKPPIFHH